MTVSWRAYVPLIPLAACTAQLSPAVPGNLDEALSALRKELRGSDVIRLADAPNCDTAALHHSVGRWIRNRWRLWAGSPLARYFAGLGVGHPEDMSSIVLESFCRRLTSRPLELRKQVREKQRYWACVRLEHKRCLAQGCRLDYERCLRSKRRIARTQR